jgi:hypothetical protein
MAPNSTIYCVESPDGIVPCSKSAKSIYRYSDSSISAAIIFQGENYRTACFGFPIEATKSSTEQNYMIINALEYFKK